VAEGGQDVVFGALGSDTSSVNVVRDFGYGGDEAAYNQAKGIVTTTAAVGTMVLAPVAQTVSAASGGMKSGKADSTKQTKTTSNTGATSGKTATSGNSGKSTTSALKLKSGETDAVGQTKTAGNAGTRGSIKGAGKGNAGVSVISEGTPKTNGAGSSIKFGSDTKSAQKLSNQMTQRGWTESTVSDTVSNPYTTRVSTNKATGNSATVYYNQAGGYVIIDDTTKAVVQVSDNINPSTWIPDPSIINPYKP
jgi:hypothetical protein